MQFINDKDDIELKTQNKKRTKETIKDEKNQFSKKIGWKCRLRETRIDQNNDQIRLTHKI